MSDVFDEVIEVPDPDQQRAFAELVGLDDLKERLVKEGRLLLDRGLLEQWSRQHHKRVIPAVREFGHRPPLIVFAGDVGTGKTTLAESFADPIARLAKITVRVLRLSLNARGSGAVGEMTRLITSAFDELVKLAPPAKTHAKSAAILIIDEADALAQSRELDQMHHEDRAGVNALIRGIDRVATAGAHCLIVICTNRVDAIDPAVMRRAAIRFDFQRPNSEQRAFVLRKALGEILVEKEIAQLSELTGVADGRDYGFTYSDLRERLIPNILVEAFPDRPISIALAISVAKRMEPTKPFASEKFARA